MSKPTEPPAKPGIQSAAFWEREPSDAEWGEALARAKVRRLRHETADQAKAERLEAGEPDEG